MSATCPTRPHVLPLLLALALLASVAGGMFVRAPEIPVERLLKNIAAYVKEKPEDPQGYYLAGRINALAYVLKADKLRAFERKGRPLPYLDPYQGKPRGGPALTGKQLRKHVTDAIVHFRKAIALKADSGLYHLGLAYILKEGASEAAHIGPPPGTAAPPKPTPQQVKKWEALISVLDTNGNVITTFGSYGNADDIGPEIAFSWLIGVGVTDRYAYMGDSLNRRLLRASLVYAAEETCAIP